MKPKYLIWIAIFLFLTNYGLLWIFSKPIPFNKEIIYWSFAIKYFGYFYLAISTISVVLVILWVFLIMIESEKTTKTILVFLFSLFLIFQCGVVFLVTGFSLRSYDHIDTLELSEKYYHLVIIDQFERRSIVLLGECEQTKYLCKFSPIYSTFGYGFSDRSNLELSWNKNQVTVSCLGNTIFVYDKYNQVCTGTDQLLCWEP